MTATVQKPFLPSDRVRANGQPLIRAAIAHAITFLSHEDTDRVVRQRWPHDRDTERLTKAAMTPTTMATADGLAITATADFFVSMGPASAGAELLKAGLSLSFNGAAAIMVPGVIATAGNAGFVQEMHPIPHRQLPITSARLSPSKFATLTSFSKETFQHSTPTIEGIVRTTLIEAVGLALDLALLSPTAGDATRPPGLLLNIAALTPSSKTNLQDAMVDDVSTLAAAVSVVAANGPIIFVASPKQAVALRLRTLLFPYMVLASSALTAGTVIAVAPNALASATDPVPRFEISDKATMHLDDAPTNISAPGAPPVVAYPVVSVFQTDSLALRLIFEMSWALRSANGLAWMQNVLW